MYVYMCMYIYTYTLAKRLLYRLLTPGVCVYWQGCKVDIFARAVAITAQAPSTSPRSKLAQSQ